MTKTSGGPVTAYENFDTTASEGTKRRIGEGATRRLAYVQSTNGRDPPSQGQRRDRLQETYGTNVIGRRLQV
jgi:hypothetical protein